MGPVERAYEAKTKELFQHLLGGQVVDRDTGGAQGMRDFDLLGWRQVKHAVEVSSVQLPAARATRAGFERLRQRPLGLSISWGLTAHETADARRIERDAPGHLNQLTALGIDKFDAIDPPHDRTAATAVAALAGLAIPVGFSMPRVSPPRLLIGGYGSGSIDPSALTQAVEREANKPDNLSKLRAAPSGATRHLALWLNDSDWYVSVLLRDPSGLPSFPPPKLPEGVDEAWALVEESDPIPVVQVARSSGGEWELLTVPLNPGCVSLAVARVPGLLRRTAHYRRPLR